MKKNNPTQVFDTGSKELDDKLKEVSDLVKTIELYGTLNVPTEIKAELQDWEGRMQFRLSQLWEETKLKEADIKIEIFKKVVELLKSIHQIK